MPLREIAPITQRVAATVPFDTNGPITDLDKNLRAANGKYDLNLSETELRASFIGTIDLANRDVKGFASTFTEYNTGTRNLLPENRPELRNPEAYTPENLYTATMGAAGFTGGVIKPDTIFHQAKLQLDDGSTLAYPPDDALKQMTAKARDENIPTGVVYLEALAAAAAVTRAALAVRDPSTAALPAAQLGNLLERVNISDTAREQTLHNFVLLDQAADKRLARSNVETAITALKKNEAGFQPDANLRETAAKLLETVGPDGVRKIAQEAKDPEVTFPMPTAMKKFNTPEAAGAFLEVVGEKVLKPTIEEAFRDNDFDRANALGNIRDALNNNLQVSRAETAGAQRTAAMGANRG